MGLFNRKKPALTISAGELQAAIDQLNAGNQKPADDLCARAGREGGDGARQAVAMAIVGGCIVPDDEG